MSRRMGVPIPVVVVMTLVVLFTWAAASPAAAQSLSGTYDIGAAQPAPFNTLTAAVNRLNTFGVTGPVVFRLTDATYPGETFPIAINAIGGASAVNTITLKPAPGAAPVVSGSSATAIFKLNGADYITIDGSNNGTTTRDLTVRNTSTATLTAAIWLSSLGAGAGCVSNTIRNVNLACGADPTVVVAENFGIFASGTALNVDGEDNNANAFVGNAITRCRFGIRLRGAAANLNDNNQVTDNLIGPAAFGPDQVSRGGIILLNQNAATVSRNVVRFVGNRLSDVPGGADRVGIGIGSDTWFSATGTATAMTVTGNVIHDIVDEKTFSAVGILVVAGSSPSGNMVANNMIFNVRANGTGPDQAIGIGIATGNGDKVVFNSIALTGDLDPPGATAATSSAAGIAVGAGAANLTLLNNISSANVTSYTATLRHYSIVAPAGHNWGTGGSNNNDLWIPSQNPQMAVGGIGTVTPYTNVATIAAWRTQFAPAQDGSSIAEAPSFVSTTDLHLDPNVPTRLESAGQQVLGVTNDVDGDSRGGIPDIGADEGPFTAAPLNDLAAVAILEPAPGSARGPGPGPAARATFENRGTSLQSNISVRFRITGPNPSPAIVYDNTTNIASLNPDDGVVQATFSPVSLAAHGSYTMTASLNLPSGDTANDQVVATFSISPPLSGTYLVGGSQAAPFHTLTSACATLGAVGVSGNVTFELVDALYAAPEETFPIAIPAYSGAGPGARLTIRPASSAGPVTVVGDAPILLSLDGADHVILDGSNNGTETRDLTIRNLFADPAVASAVVWGRTIGGDPATMNTIRNARIVGNSGTTTLIGVGFGGTTPGSFGTLNNGNTITNTEISRVQFGIVCFGASAASKNTGTLISKNIINRPAPDNVGISGIMVGYEDGVYIIENVIGGIASPGATAFGISVGLQAASNLLANVGFEVADAFVSRNRITGVSSLSTGFANSAVGIGSAAVPSGRGLAIVNNMISGITSPAGPQDLTAGIYLRNSAGSTLIAHNSVHLAGDRGPATDPSFACAIGGTGQSTLVLNNIFTNSQTATSAGKTFAIGLGSTLYAPLNSNYNDFVTTGPSARFSIVGGFTNTPGERTSLADWRTTTGKDANSISADPLFVAPSDLHITSPASPVSNAGTILVATDFDGQTRSNPPDIGADEFASVWPALTINDVAVSEGAWFETEDMAFTVQLAQATTDTVWFEYRTTTGTASPDTDYVAVPVPQRAGIPPGATDGLVTITIKGDFLDEPDEIVRVRISNAVFALLADSIGVGTIVDDDITTGVPDIAPVVTSLAPGYPNPFRRSTSLPFALREAGMVRIDLFDVQGRLVRRLLDEARPSGSDRVEWDGLDDGGRPVPSGFYVARMRADGQEYTRSLRVVR